MATTFTSYNLLPNEKRLMVEHMKTYGFTTVVHMLRSRNDALTELLGWHLLAMIDQSYKGRRIKSEMWRPKWVQLPSGKVVKADELEILSERG